MTVREVNKVRITEADKNFLNRRGYHLTNEQIVIDYDYNESVCYNVFKGSWTRSGTVRDCGDHYIIACHSRYDRIDKGTYKITKDVEDI